MDYVSDVTKHYMEKGGKMELTKIKNKIFDRLDTLGYNSNMMKGIIGEIKQIIESEMVIKNEKKTL